MWYNTIKKNLYHLYKTGGTTPLNIIGSVFDRFIYLLLIKFNTDTQTIGQFSPNKMNQG